jgi:hypothetical protein
VGPTGIENDPAAAAALDESTFYSVALGTTVEFSLRFANDGCDAGARLARVYPLTIFVVFAPAVRFEAHRVFVVVPTVE